MIDPAEAAAQLLLTRKEASRLIGVSVVTFDSWRKKLDFPAPASTLGYPRWRRRDIEAFVDSMEVV